MSPATIAAVVLDGSGRPVPDVAVAVVAAPGPVQDVAALTGADGRAVLSVPGPGRYAVLATAADARTARASVQVDAPGTQVELHLADPEVTGRTRQSSRPIT